MLDVGGAMIVTADHGNADEMFERNKKTKAVLLGPGGRPQAKTSHSLNRVPFHVFAPDYELAIAELEKDGGLANVAATTMHLLGLEAPEGYEPSLLG